MVTRIQSVHFDADLKLIQFIEEKLSSLDHFLAKSTIEAKVVLTLEKVGKIQDKIVEILINLPGRAVVAKSRNKSFERALFETLQSIKRQILKYKSKIQEKQ